MPLGNLVSLMSVPLAFGLGFNGIIPPPEDTGSPGKTPNKSTLVLGGGWPWDDAEEARIKAVEVTPEERKFYARPTVQGEQRALEAKGKAGAFDMRTPRRKAPSPKKVAAQRSSRPSSPALSPDRKSRPSRSPRSPISPHDRLSTSPIAGDAVWSASTQGYTGSGKFVTLTAASVATSAMRTPADKLFDRADTRGRSVMYD